MAAKIKIQTNIVFWIKEASAAVVIVSPLKNKRKGILPPINPIDNSNRHCFLVIDLKEEKFQAPKIIAVIDSAAKEFLRNVKTYGLAKLTANLFIKIENPEIKAVVKTRKYPLFFIFACPVE